MKFPLAKDGYKYRPLKKGLNGWDVWALQTNINATGISVSNDGAFGPLTEAAVKRFQLREALATDGIAGIRTQTSVAECLWEPAEASQSIPKGLLNGIVAGESMCLGGQHTAAYKNRKRDVGLTQENIIVTDEELAVAFNGAGAISRLAGTLRTRKAYAKNLSNEKAWKYGAVLYHNWRAASNRYVDGTIASWKYTAYNRVKDTNVSYTMEEPAQWIIDIGVANVKTGYQWAEHYISTKTLYVKNWTT